MVNHKPGDIISSLSIMVVKEINPTPVIDKDAGYKTVTNTDIISTNYHLYSITGRKRAYKNRGER